MAKKKIKILLIDDDPFMLRMYSTKFLGEGAIVEGAQTAAEGFGDAKKFKPDVILLDIMLPDEDGLTLLKKLKRTKETAHIPVIILSNLSQGAYREQALLLGAADHMVKAYFDPSEISARVHTLLQL